jgi:hypothetical protein
MEDRIMFRKITVMLGVVLVLISSIGLLMGSMALLSVSPAAQSNMNEAAFNTAMQNMQQDMKETADNISYDDVQRTMDSPEFKRYVFGMAGSIPITLWTHWLRPGELETWDWFFWSFRISGYGVHWSQYRCCSGLDRPGHSGSSW